jgi:OmpA-OmpF porin, OOP family
MSTPLLDQVKSLFTNEVVQSAANHFGESESNISKAMTGIIPALLGGLAKKSEMPGGASEVVDLILKAGGSGPINNVSGLLGNPQQLAGGWDLVKGLFGSQSDNLLGKLAGFSGLKPSSTTGLLGMAVPMITGLLGKYMKDNALNASGLATILSSQKSSIMNAIPGGFGLNNILSNAFSTKGSTPLPIIPQVDATAASRGGGDNKWLLPLVLLLGLGALIWWWLSGKNAEDTAKSVETNVVAPVADAVQDASAAIKGKLDAAGNWIYDLGEMLEIELPDGTKMKVGANSSEAKLFRFLSDPNFVVNEVDKTQGWISLDRVYFETGKDILTAESKAQLVNLAAIMKAYPNSAMKLGGYTDNTGDPAANLSLSETRAKAAMEAVKGMGIDASRLSAEGYGDMHPITSNDTDEGRAQNRRVDVRVTRK